MKTEATFVRSAAGAAGFPADRAPEVALVGRSNVGKSSLINALVRRPLARASAAPGKTRLANIYRVARGGIGPLYLVDLPGYGYARGGDKAVSGFDELTRAFFGQVGQVGQVGQGGRVGKAGSSPPGAPALPAPPAHTSALLIVDARHPGLQNDVQAWRWLCAVVEHVAIVATKIDKLARGQRIRALRELESVFQAPVLPVSAATGEGLDELWKLIDKLANSNNRKPLRPNNPSRATAHLPRPNE